MTVLVLSNNFTGHDLRFSKHDSQTETKYDNYLCILLLVKIPIQGGALKCAEAMGYRASHIYCLSCNFPSPANNHSARPALLLNVTRTPY